MTQQAMDGKKAATGRIGRALFGLLAVLSLPFWAAAISLGWDAIHLPERTWLLASVQMWKASVLCLGLAGGIVGSAIALGSARRRQSGTGLALVLLGMSCVSLSFVMGWFAEKLVIGSSASSIWFVLPAALMFASLVTLIESLRIVEKPAAEPSAFEASVEQPQPLSRL